MRSLPIARVCCGAVSTCRASAVFWRASALSGPVSLCSAGAPAVPRNVARIFGPTAAGTLERLVGEVRKLPPEVHPTVQALWCQPKCFYAMANHLGAMQEAAAVVAGITSLPDVPLVVISSGDQSPEILARHQALAALSSQGRHVIAEIGHWIQFDEPELVVTTIRDVVRSHARHG